MKIIDKMRLDDTTRQLLSREISCMERLSHRHLITLFEIHESFSRLCLVMECAAEGNLQSRVEDNGPFSEPQAKAVFSQIAAGVSHMVGPPHSLCHSVSESDPPTQHGNGVIHRDLKPENVLYVSSTQVKIGDFGFSTPVTDSLLSTFCGSPVFAAPELLQEQSYMGPPVDMWALGATLFYIVTGNVPFPGSSVLQVKERVLSGSYISPSRVGPLCRELVAKLLAMEPSNRPTISATLQDPWLEEVGERNTECPPTEGEADAGVVAQMRDLGVPVGQDLSCLLGEPRTAVAGTYRILLHQKQQRSELPPALPPSPPADTSTRRKSIACTIL